MKIFYYKFNSIFFLKNQCFIFQFVVDCEFFKKETRSIQLPVTHLFSFGKYFDFGNFFLFFFFSVFGFTGSSLLHGIFSSCNAWASHCGGIFVVECVFQVCGLQQLWLMSSRVQTQQLQYMGLVPLRHVGSSWIRIKRVSCISREILYH